MMNFLPTSKMAKTILGLGALFLMLFSIALIVMGLGNLQDSRSRASLSDDARELSKELLSSEGDASDKIIIASKRKEKIKELAKSDPENFLLFVIPQDIQKTLPLQAQESIEKRVTLKGVIHEEVIEEHNPENKSESKIPSLIFQNIDSQGNSINTYQLIIREGLEPDFDGHVNVEGYVIDNLLIPIKISKEDLQTRSNNLQLGQDVLGINTTGVNKLAVIMVNFKNDDSDIKNNFTQQQLETIYFSAPNSVANYIKDTSLGNVTIRGDINDIYGWLDLEGYTRKDVCDIYEETESAKGFKRAINEMVKPIALSRGKTLADYNIKAYIFPTIKDDESVGPHCNWNAIAYGIPGDNVVQPIHFLNGDYDGLNDVDHGPLDGAASIRFYSGILAHESGHNLGLSHAHGIYCGDKAISSYANCKIWRYGDRYDLLGGAWDFHSHTSVKNKMLLGWIPTTNKKTVTQTGTYTIYSGSKTRQGQIQQLIIDRPTDGGNYYLDYKSKNNGDGQAPPVVYEGALMRISEVNLPPMGNEGGGTSDEWRTRQTYLVDVDKSGGTYRGGLMDPTFKDGLTFYDKRNEITIKQLSHDSESVTLRVTIGPPPCEKLDPGLIIAEPALSGAAGEKVRYSLTVKNNNSATCPTTTFDLTNAPPEDFTATFSKENVSLASGAQATVFLDITSPSSASVDQNPYTTKINVENSSNSTFSKTKQVNYSIELLSSVPTTIPTNSPTPTKKPTPTPTKRPTPTPTRIITPTPTPTKAPPLTSAPTVTPIPGSTILRFSSIKLHGIGLGGDNANPNSTGNMNPNNTTRKLIVGLYDASDKLFEKFEGNIAFRSETGDFSGDIVVPNSIPENTPYTIKIKSSRYLIKSVGVKRINKNFVNEISSASVTVGDLNSDNNMDQADYDIISDCYEGLSGPKNCSDESKKTLADINDDGKVSLLDVNLFIRESSVIRGD